MNATTDILPRRAEDEADLGGLLLSVPALADVAGVSRVHVWRRVRDGRLVPDFRTDDGTALFLPTRLPQLLAAVT